jgi:hypothetical protein
MKPLINTCIYIKTSDARRKNVYVTEDEDAGPDNPAIPLGCPAIGGAGQGVRFHGLHLHGFSSWADTSCSSTGGDSGGGEQNFRKTATSKGEERSGIKQRMDMLQIYQAIVVNQTTYKQQRLLFSVMVTCT